MLKLITTEELMTELKVSKSTLYRWRKEGLPHKKLGHKTVRYDLEKVIKWLEEKD